MPNPRSNPTLFYITFLSERVPLSYSFHWQMVPLSVIPSLELCISFNCCKRINHCTKPENFFELFTLIKLPSVAFLGHFTDQVTDFPRDFTSWSIWNGTLSYTWSLEKVPLSGRASPYTPLQGVSPPPDPKRTTEWSTSK